MNYSEGHLPISSEGLATAISRTDFSRHAVTVVGYGSMGRQYVAALQALGVSLIRVCSRARSQIEVFRGNSKIEEFPDGFEQLAISPKTRELGIIATPVELSIRAAERLVDLGFKRLLIEKPVALRASKIKKLAEKFHSKGIEAICAYNRVAYPSVIECAYRVDQDGGITSCTYNLTEMIKPDWLDRFAKQELKRWGIANSLHVVSMAHSLIGLPREWKGYRSGAISWHPSGSVFVGAGIAGDGIPFSYHADWGSKGRWNLEVHTRKASYRFCPMEKLLRRELALSEWQDVPVTSLEPQVKVGVLEQTAAMLDAEIGRHVPLLSLEDGIALTVYGEKVFGYR